MIGLGIVGTAITIIIVVGIVIWVLSLRRVVPRDEAHVIIQGKEAYVKSGVAEIRGWTGGTYYQFPAWIPLIGRVVKVVPLRVIEIKIINMVTFAAKNARFQLSASIYVRVQDALVAAQRWPGRTVEDYITGVKELVENAIRNTTTAFAAEDVIEKKEEIASKLRESLKDDMAEYGCVITNVAIINISDAPGSTVITAIAKKREAEIEAESRKIVAVKMKEAEIAEAENRQLAEIRKAEADEAIGRRQQERDQNIAKAQEEARKAQMMVVQVEKVRAAEIERDAAIKVAEGDKQATILRKEGEAEGIKLTGGAEAEVIKAKGLSEAAAKEALAEALNKLQETGRIFRELDVREKIGVEGMNALGKAQLRLISTQPLTDIIQLFGASGGANLGAMLEALKATGGLEQLIQLLTALQKKAESEKKLEPTLEPTKDKKSNK